MSDRIKLYHGGPSVVRIPDLSMRREDIDFGRGFYLTNDFERSAKWACRIVTSVVNEYELSLEGLKVHRFAPDVEWLDFVLANRHLSSMTGVFADYSNCDVLVGPIADDKLFSLLELYEDGVVSADVAVEVMNCMNYGVQYAIKTEKAIQNLTHIGHVQILGKERDEYKRQFKEDAKEAGQRTKTLLRERNQGR